jgi:hypothetical protein
MAAWHGAVGSELAAVALTLKPRRHRSPQDARRAIVGLKQWFGLRFKVDSLKPLGVG